MDGKLVMNDDVLVVPRWVYSRLSRCYPSSVDEEVVGFASPLDVKVLESGDVSEIRGFVSFIFHSHPPDMPVPSPADLKTLEVLPLMYGILSSLRGVKVISFYYNREFAVKDERFVKSEEKSCCGMRYHMVMRPLNPVLRYLHPNPLSPQILRIIDVLYKAMVLGK